MKAKLSFAIALSRKAELLILDEATFRALDRSNVIAWRKEGYQYKILVKDRKRVARDHLGTIVEPATIEETMLFYAKGRSR